VDTIDLPRLPGTASFSGTDRFRVVRMLGSGAHGTVYEVVDLQRDDRIALKRLERTEPFARERFKAEFRSLSDLRHPNLVALHELVNDGREMFFTMELAAHGELTAWRSACGSGAGWEDLEALLGDVAAGLQALHASGKLHRDLKPANVLLTRPKRAVVADFGLVGDAGAAGGAAVGTPGFIAPEVLAGAPHGPPSDWYAFGATIHALLAGRPPGHGAALPLAGDEAALGRLRALCERLLAPEPAGRPAGGEVLAALGRAERTPAAGDRASWVGRQGELASLLHALELARAGQAVAAHVRGPAGMGKTALVGAALEAMAARTPILPLRGRCFERETTPYRAFEGVAEDLAKALGALDREALAAVVPEPFPSLARLFPALGAAVRGHLATAPADARELRRRAVEELRQLLRRLDARAKVVVVLDDFQDADADSAWVLEELLAPGGPPALAVAVDREARARGPDEAGAGAILARSEPAVVTVDVPVGPLADEEREALLRALGVAEPAGGWGAREPARSPLELVELAASLRGGEPDAPLESLVLRRVEALAGPAREVAEVVAVAGHPISEDAVRRAAPAGRITAAVLEELRAARLTRAVMAGGRALLEPMHDLARRVLVGALPPERRAALHASIAQALEETGGGAHLVLEHLERAGLRERAEAMVEPAAAQAEAALAFERAAALLDRAARGAGAPERRLELRRRQGQALVAAGHAWRAGEAYEDAAAAAAEAGVDRAPWLSAAAEHLLRAGKLDRGVQLLQEVLRSVGIGMARGRAGMMARILWTRMRLGRAGPLGGSADPEVLRRFDACWAAAMGFGSVDALRGAEFEALSTAIGLRCGEPHRVCRALGANASYLASVGGRRAWAEARRNLAELEAIARAHPSPAAEAFALFTRAIVAFFEGAWGESTRAGEKAEAILRRRCQGSTWELVMAAGYSTTARAYTGELRGLAERHAAVVRDMDERGDLLGSVTLRLGTRNRGWLALDRPEEAERMDREAMERWPVPGYHSQHYMHLVGACDLELYRGKPAAALERLAADWPRLRANFFFTRDFVRAELNALRARCAIAAALSAEGAAVGRLKALARKSARVLERSGFLAARPWAESSWAGLALVEGERARAAERYERAAAAFDAVGMGPSAAAARRQALLAVGRDAAEAEEALRAAGVVSPERFARMLGPARP